ncbi:MAG: peptidoglycan bridge formation glycyltransferase FemA/FemB family protein [Candidatus Obscuribacterales bacterium]|nr:peptidoglycan bridge formation glycyltransferase FemA/FemB family protein [Candidatus Obscuribacterales bacterium]
MSVLTTRVFDNVDPDPELAQQWANLISASNESGIMQSIDWARFKRSQGFRTFQVLVSDTNHLLGGTIGYMPASRRGASVLMSPDGPVVPWQNEGLARQILVLIQEQITSFSCANDLVGWRIEPRIILPSPRLLRSFSRAPFDLLPQETLYLNLEASEDEILAQMRPKGRYNTRLAAKRGVTVRAITGPDAARVLYSCLCEAGQRDGFFVEPHSFFSQLLESLSPDILKCFQAEYDGEILGAILVTTFGQRATYLYGGISSHKRNLMAGYLLQWQAILTAKESGCRFYDFYGFDPFGASTHLYAKFSQFKRQFGGKVMRFVGGRDLYFYDQLVDVVVKAVNELDSAIGRSEPL